MKATGKKIARPGIFGYHSYRDFLRDYLAYRKSAGDGTSLRSLAREAGIAMGYLPMVVAGTRALSANALAKLAGPLGLSPAERSYLEQLRNVSDSGAPAVQIEALERIQRFRAYRKLNQNESAVFRYLSRWYHVAIREMAGLAGFRADPAWIQARLREHVPLKEIESALAFLVDSGYIKMDRDLKCEGDIFALSLANFHREMLAQAARSIENAVATERTIMGHTLSIPRERYGELNRILEDALAKIVALEKPGRDGNAVYHVVFSAFPLTKEPK